jgi:hypothetical protein
VSKRDYDSDHISDSVEVNSKGLAGLAGELIAVADITDNLDCNPGTLGSVSYQGWH